MDVLPLPLTDTSKHKIFTAVPLKSVYECEEASESGVQACPPGQRQQQQPVCVLKEFELDCKALRRSAHVMQQLRHPNIMPLLGLAATVDSDTGLEKYYLQMPLLPLSLQGWLDGAEGKKTMDSQKLADVQFAILKGILQGLSFLHCMGVVHCDLKPANIMLTADYQPVITDFETCRAPAVLQTATLAFQRVGTLAYISPEVKAGADFSPPSDIYAFAILLCEVLQGKKCYSADELNTQFLVSRSLMAKCFMADPTLRPSALELLLDPYFTISPSAVRGKCVVQACCEDPTAACKANSIGCLEGHLTCRECLESCVNGQLDDLRQQELKRGSVFCPLYPVSCSGKVAFSDAQLSSVLPSACFQRYVQGKIDVEQKKFRVELVTQMEKRLLHQLEEMGKLSEEERKVHLIRLQLVAQLNLACPRCKTVFLDYFNGCFAVSCGSCPCSFCAWCIMDCGSDAHTHAARCALNPRQGDVFNTESEFNRVQMQRRKQLLLTKLNGLDAQTRQSVLRSMEIDLTDLGLAELLVGVGAGGHREKTKGGAMMEGLWDEGFAAQLLDEAEDLIV